MTGFCSSSEFSNVSKLQWVGSFWPTASQRKNFSFESQKVSAASQTITESFTLISKCWYVKVILWLNTEIYKHLKVLEVLLMSLGVKRATFGFPSSCRTFSMSRWSCWVTCQQGSPRATVMLCRSVPVRQETLLLANVSFICTEQKGQEEHPTISANVSFKFFFRYAWERCRVALM